MLRAPRSGLATRVRGVSRTPSAAEAAAAAPSHPPTASRPDPEWLNSEERTEAINSNERSMYRSFGALMALTATALFACSMKLQHEESVEVEARRQEK